VDGAPVSSNTVTFAKPKHIDLTDPEISAKVAMRRRGATVVRLKAKRPALYVWLELDGVDARFSENFFDLLPNETREILIQPETEMTASEIEKSLRVRSLRDTY
jgi:beta-mannosidase